MQANHTTRMAGQENMKTTMRVGQENMDPATNS
jgi:hypothetical protein